MTSYSIQPNRGGSIADVVVVGDDKEDVRSWQTRCGIDRENQIRLVKLAHVRYQPWNIQTLKRLPGFFSIADFGMQVAYNADGQIWYRGYGEDQYSHITTSSGRDIIRPGGYVVSSVHALTRSRAARLPTASEIEELKDAPGGGHILSLTDPEWCPINLMFGQVPSETGDYPKLLTINYELEKPHTLKFQRFSTGPAAVHKLGHFDVYVQKFEEMVQFYTTTFNIAPIDFLYIDTQGGHRKNVALFAHIDRGQDLVDHNTFFISTNSTTHIHHCSFEVHDFDTQNLGHQWLAQKGINPYGALAGIF